MSNPTPPAIGATRPAPAVARRLVPSLPRDAWLVLGGDALSAVGTGTTTPPTIDPLGQLARAVQNMAAQVAELHGDGSAKEA